MEDLVAALRDPEWNIRIRAANALGKSGDPRAIEPFMTALKIGCSMKTYLQYALLLQETGSLAIVPRPFWTF